MTETPMRPPESPDWIGVSEAELPLEQAFRWTNLPHCGGIVVFCGTVRDHSDGRPEVTELEYEAYVDQVVPKLTDVARRRSSPLAGDRPAGAAPSDRAAAGR